MKALGAHFILISYKLRRIKECYRFTFTEVSTRTYSWKQTEIDNRHNSNPQECCELHLVDLELS